MHEIREKFIHEFVHEFMPEDYVFKGQLQRFDKLSLFDRFRHVENGFDIIF